MKNLTELHIENSELTSEIQFLKKEIEFLLKLLRNAYSVSVNIEKIKLLDGYWQTFEQSIDKLDILQKKIKKEERILADLYKDGFADTEKTFFKEDEFAKDFYQINKEVKVFKQSFYGYMNGCSGCSLKNQ